MSPGAAAEHDRYGGLDVDQHLAGVGVDDGVIGEVPDAGWETVGEVAGP